MSDRDTSQHGDNAATRVVLAAARALTDHDDSRIPETFPVASSDKTDRLVGMRRALDDYARRAHDEVAVAPWQSRPSAVMANTQAAGDLLRVIVAYAQAATGDMRPPEPTAETLLLAVLSWRLAAGSAADALESVGSALAACEAGRLAAAATSGPDRDRAVRTFNDANDELDRTRTGRSHPSAEPPFAAQATSTVGWVFTRLAQDAYSLGLTLLAHGEHIRARRWLAFAHLHGIRQAASLIPPVRFASGTSDDRRIDFPGETARWRERADLANKMAALFPASDDVSTTGPGPEDTPLLPCIHIAGVQCYFYLNGDTGAFTVSLDLDTAEPWVLVGDAEVPIEVNIGDRVVYAP